MNWLTRWYSRRRRYDEFSESIREHLDKKIMYPDQRNNYVIVRISNESSGSGGTYDSQRFKH